MNLFCVKKILRIFFGSQQNWTIFRGHFYAFKGLFLRSRHRMVVFLSELSSYPILDVCE